MKFTEDNIKRSASERVQSDEYLNMADNLLKETATDMWNQYNTVNEAFEQRIHETNVAKDKIQNHLSAVFKILIYDFNFLKTIYKT
jgi:hypothetical protein